MNAPALCPRLGLCRLTYEKALQVRQMLRHLRDPEPELRAEIARTLQREPQLALYVRKGRMQRCDYCRDMHIVTWTQQEYNAMVPRPRHPNLDPIISDKPRIARYQY